MFDGQGTQWPGMGEDVFKRFEVAKEVYTSASEAVGIDMRRACFGDNTFLLKDTRVAQPAIATVGLAKYRAWQESNPEPDVITGLSMGLYVAVGISAIKSALESGDQAEVNYKTIKLVRDRAKIMFDVAEGKDGTMVPVIGPRRREIERKIKGTGAHIGVYLDEKIFTLTGRRVDVETAKHRLLDISAKILEHLPIHQAAHSDLQAETVEPLGALLNNIGITVPRIKIAANGDFYLDHPEQIIAHLLEQMTEPADWHATENMLVLHGVRRIAQFGADEKRSLARQMTKNHKELNIDSIIFPESG